MSRELYLGSQSTKHGYWTSFEDDPHLATVKSTVRYKCTPCIEGLYNQLIQGKQEIRMDNAMGCWKVVAVLNNEEEAKIY